MQFGRCVRRAPPPFPDAPPLFLLDTPTALCQHGCKHGECVGPNKCKCFPGFTGKTCNQGKAPPPEERLVVSGSG
ncbi:hypothetical protein Z043_122369 [Scleropages formosus]|uniref:EGF-like domain-containing protein n=1 Tax=Scleropages formosus TaxID=113540 RepID=A0A0P7UK86_SCLFO|nr:hypothetical protein Z043_122369 [Scleropages formosus]